MKGNERTVGLASLSDFQMVEMMLEALWKWIDFEFAFAEPVVLNQSFPSYLTVVVVRRPERPAGQSAGLDLPSQRAPLRCQAHVRPGGPGLPDVPPRSQSQAGQSELAGGVGPLGPHQLPVLPVAEQMQLVVPESRREGGHPKHRGQAGHAEQHR